MIISITLFLVPLWISIPSRLILRLHRPHINLLPLRNSNSKVRIRNKSPSKNDRISFPRSDMFLCLFRRVLTIREKLLSEFEFLD